MSSTTLLRLATPLQKLKHRLQNESDGCPLGALLEAAPAAVIGKDTPMGPRRVLGREFCRKCRTRRHLRSKSSLRMVLVFPSKRFPTSATSFRTMSTAGTAEGVVGARRELRCAVEGWSL